MGHLCSARHVQQVSTAAEISGWADSSCPSGRRWFLRVDGHELSGGSLGQWGDSFPGECFGEAMRIAFGEHEMSVVE